MDQRKPSGWFNTEYVGCNDVSKRHLQQGSSQVDGHEDGCQGGVSTLHQMDGVQEDHMTRDHQEDEDLCRSMVGS